MVADAGESTRWSSGPAVTLSEALALLPPLAPVTVCEPALVAVHAAPLQEPFGAIEKLVVDVRSPSELPYWSRPAAVYACDPPEVMEAVDGESTRWSSAAGPMVKAAVAVFPAAVALTVWSPATLAVQMWPVHDPSGETEKDVSAVTSPSELPAPSKASTVYACEPPAAIVASLGLTTM